MCGHVGTAGDLFYKDEAMMKRMLILDFFRGPDSTGFAAVRKSDNEVKLAKVASNPIDLFDTKSFSSALTASTSKVFMGHNRAATKGKVNRANAHPFEFDHIVGCHNGTLDNAAWVQLEDYIDEKFDVDSAAIIAGIASHGIEEVVPLLTGAWALVWYDAHEDTINFLKNDQRPLWWAISENLKQIFWSSEHWMMDVGLLKTSGVNDKYKLKVDEKGYCFWAFEDDMLYSFKLGDLISGAYKDIPDPRVKKIKGAEKKVVSYASSHGGSGTNPFQHRHGTHTGSTKTGTTSSHGGTSHAVSEVICLDVTKFDPYGAYLTKDEFMAIAAYGCSWCGADVDYDQPGCWVWPNDDVILCPHCVRQHDEDKDTEGGPVIPVSRVYV